MNEHSFINYRTEMARITDKSKIKRLKQSTMKLVVEKGFGGASAASIAVDAKVAVGYFYLHYKGKYAMVNALLHDVYQEIMDKLEELVHNGSTVHEVVRELIRHFFSMANTDPVKIKFLYVLTNDYSFVIDKEVRENAFQFIYKIMEAGQAEQMLDPKITAEDLYLFLVINTIQYINQQFKNTPENILLTQKDEEHLLYLINKILK